MRKIFLFVFLFAALAGAQTCVPTGGVTCSPNLQLWLPPFGYQNWNVPMNANSTILDTFSTTVIVDDPTVSQNVNQPPTTFTDFNEPLVYGSPATLYFGPSANLFDSILTRTAPATFTLDANIQGAGGGSLTLTTVNALSGYLVNNTGGTVGECLGSDGTAYDTPVSCLTSGSLFYQTVQAAGTAQTQRPVLNFSPRFSLSDSSSPARTTVDLASTITAGSCTICSLNYDAYGRITGASNAPAGTTVAVTHFSTCALVHYSSSDQNCYVSNQSWGTTIVGSYNILCTIDQSFTGGAHASGGLQTVIGYNSAGNTATTFAYFLGNVNDSAAGESYNATCVAISS